MTSEWPRTVAMGTGPGVAHELTGKHGCGVILDLLFDVHEATIPLVEGGGRSSLLKKRGLLPLFFARSVSGDCRTAEAHAKADERRGSDSLRGGVEAG